MGLKVGVLVVFFSDALSAHSLVASLEAPLTGYVCVSIVGVKAQGSIVSASRTLGPPHHIGFDLGIGHHGRKLPSSRVDEPVGDLV
jgi:hypothetical protein